jgi:hypothetical protein
MNVRDSAEMWNVEASCGHVITVRIGESQVHNCELEKRLQILTERISELERQADRAYDWEREVRERLGYG